jgi:hypothetical protein
MIGNGTGRRRAGVPLGVCTALLLGGLFSLRPADPLLADPPRAAQFQAELASAAATAQSALDRLAGALRSALDEARRGAAATVAGDDVPGAHLTAAAERFMSATRPMAGGQAALVHLAALLAARPATPAPSLSVSAGELTSVAGQLRAAASAADAFREMRQSSRAVLDGLRATLVALEAGDARGALAAAKRGSASLDAVRAWPGRIDTLPVWVDTSDRLLRALAELAEARIDGDASAAATAAERYAMAARDAERADRAWAIALAEGGGAVTSPALSAAADTLGRVEATDAQLAPLVHP